jgi:hypothetical protein
MLKKDIAFQVGGWQIDDMTNAAMTMVREIATTMNSVVKHKMTAKEMALTPHNLRGEFAVTADGSQWIWNAHFEHWAMWKRGSNN